MPDRYDEQIREYFDQWKADFEARRFAYNHPIDDAETYRVSDGLSRLSSSVPRYMSGWEVFASSRHPFDPSQTLTVCLHGYSKAEAEFHAAREWLDCHIKLYREYKVEDVPQP